MREDSVTAAITAAGSVAALARALGIKPQAVSQWTKIPTERILDVERATGIARAELRPELFAPKSAELAVTA
jgi:DNA-binding transcriptional regulator YdaS (Cro superfamily)